MFIGASSVLLWVGMMLFGVGIGNATSLPPLIAQAEFPRHQVARVVALIVAIAQGCYAFAPALFGGVRTLFNGPDSDVIVLALAASIQAAAILILISTQPH